MRFKELIDLGELDVSGLAQANDIHYTTAAPESRIDDYPAAIRRKLFAFRDFCQKEHAFPVFTGDVTHVSAVKHPDVSFLLEYFWDFKIRPYLIAGNHDMSGGNPATLVSRPFWSIRNSRSVMYGKDVMFTARPSGLKVYIAGSDYDTDMEGDTSGYMVWDSRHAAEADLVVLVCHGMVMPTGKSFVADYVSNESLAACGADVLMCGHYHPRVGFPKSLVGLGRKGVPALANPGAFSRGSVAESDMKRVPAFGFLRFRDRPIQGSGLAGLVLWEEHDLPHDPADAVFSPTARRKAGEEGRTRKFKELVETLKAGTGLAEGSDQEGGEEDFFISAIMKMDGIPDGITEQAVTWIREAALDGATT